MGLNMFTQFSMKRWKASLSWKIDEIETAASKVNTFNSPNFIE